MRAGPPDRVGTRRPPHRAPHAVAGHVRPDRVAHGLLVPAPLRLQVPGLPVRRRGRRPEGVTRRGRVPRGHLAPRRPGPGAVSARRRIVVATPDTLTAKMAGPAIRAWHIATLLSAEHDVELVTTSHCDITPSGFRASAVDDERMQELEQWCDVFILQGWIMAGRPYLFGSEK